MKVGSKAYVMMIRKIYWFSVFVMLVCMNFYFMKHFDMIKLHTVGQVVLKIGSWFSIVIVSIFHLLDLFNPIYEKPNWKLVYPQLRNNKK